VWPIDLVQHHACGLLLSALDFIRMLKMQSAPDFRSVAAERAADANRFLAVRTRSLWLE
jgi:hypothetical protein